MIAGATRRPWAASPKAFAGVNQLLAGDKVIGTIRRPADAALIVRAVNAHADLVGALETIAKVNPARCDAYAVFRIVNVARRALSLARGDGA